MYIRNQMWKKRCKECGNEILVERVKEELCWECREKIRKAVRKSEFKEKE